jgi:predicted transcriptional regulator of viral defense system
MNKTTTAVLTHLIPTSPVFTTRAAAETAAVAVDVATRDLSRLAARGVVTRITTGVWADTRHPDFSPYAVVPHLLRVRQSRVPGYLSLLTALNLRGMIQQIPRVFQVVVTTQRRAVKTPVGTYEFHRIRPPLFGGFEPFGQLANFDVATSAKALFDILYLSVRRSRRFSHLPELELGRDFRESELEHWIRRIPYPPVRTAVVARWLKLKAEVGRGGLE